VYISAPCTEHQLGTGSLQNLVLLYDLCRRFSERQFSGMDETSSGLQEVEVVRAPRRHMKVARLSALNTGHVQYPGNIPGTYSCQRLCQPPGLSQ
jgi:hypothetical protein